MEVAALPSPAHLVPPSFNGPAGSCCPSPHRTTESLHCKNSSLGDPAAPAGASLPVLGSAGASTAAFVADRATKQKYLAERQARHAAAAAAEQASAKQSQLTRALQATSCSKQEAPVEHGVPAGPASSNTHRGLFERLEPGRRVVPPRGAATAGTAIHSHPPGSLAAPAAASSPLYSAFTASLTHEFTGKFTVSPGSLQGVLVGSGTVLGVPLRKCQSALELGGSGSISGTVSVGSINSTIPEQMAVSQGGEASSLDCRVGCNNTQRAQALQRYRAKRALRNFGHTIKYQCRKTLADSRTRVGGRFARNTEAKSAVPHDKQRDQEQGQEGCQKEQEQQGLPSSSELRTHSLGASLQQDHHNMRGVKHGAAEGRSCGSAGGESYPPTATAVATATASAPQRRVGLRSRSRSSRSQLIPSNPPPPDPLRQQTPQLSCSQVSSEGGAALAAAGPTGCSTEGGGALAAAGPTGCSSRQPKAAASELPGSSVLNQPVSMEVMESSELEDVLLEDVAPHNTTGATAGDLCSSLPATGDQQPGTAGALGLDSSGNSLKVEPALTPAGGCPAAAALPGGGTPEQLLQGCQLEKAPKLRRCGLSGTFSQLRMHCWDVAPGATAAAGGADSASRTAGRSTVAFSRSLPEGNSISMPCAAGAARGELSGLGFKRGSFCMGAMQGDYSNLSLETAGACSRMEDLLLPLDSGDGGIPTPASVNRSAGAGALQLLASGGSGAWSQQGLQMSTSGAVMLQHGLEPCRSDAAWSRQGLPPSGCDTPWVQQGMGPPQATAAAAAVPMDTTQPAAAPTFNVGAPCAPWTGGGNAASSHTAAVLPQQLGPEGGTLAALLEGWPAGCADGAAVVAALGSPAALPAAVQDAGSGSKAAVARGWQVVVAASGGKGPANPSWQPVPALAAPAAGDGGGGLCWQAPAASPLVHGAAAAAGPAVQSGGLQGSFSTFSTAAAQQYPQASIPAQGPHSTPVSAPHPAADTDLMVDQTALGLTNSGSLTTGVADGEVDELEQELMQLPWAAFARVLPLAKDQGGA